MWEKCEKGRHLFNYRPKVYHKIKHKLETKKGAIIISQSRLGYVKLNEYLHKTNSAESDLCQCGEIERNRKAMKRN